MSPEQIRLIRRLTLNDPNTVKEVMGGGADQALTLRPQGQALVKIVTLLSADSDPTTLRWAVDIGLAVGLDDDIFSARLVAPVIGLARLSSAMPHLMNPLELEVVED